MRLLQEDASNVVFTRRYGCHNLGAWPTLLHYRGVSHSTWCSRVFLAHCCSLAAGGHLLLPQVKPKRPPILRRRGRWPVRAPMRRSASRAMGKARCRVPCPVVKTVRWIVRDLVSNCRAHGYTWMWPGMIQANYGRNFQTRVAWEDIRPGISIILARSSCIKMVWR